MEWLVQIAPYDELDTYNDASSINVILVQDFATVYVLVFQISHQRTYFSTNPHKTEVFTAFWSGE